MDKSPNIECCKYTTEELILLAGASYETITNAIDNGEVELDENSTIH